MWRLALKNLWAYKRRLLTSAFSVVLGISFLAGSFVFTDTLKGLFSDLFSSSVAGVDAVVRTEQTFKVDDSPYTDGRANVPVELAIDVRKIDGVGAAEADIQGYAQMINKKGKLLKTGNAPTFGRMWGEDPLLNPYKLFSGRAPTKAGEIVIDRALIKASKYKVGDKAKVNTSGPIKEFTIVGDITFGTSDSSLGASTVFFSKEEGPSLLLKSGEAQAILVRAKAGVTEEQLATTIRKALTNAKGVGSAKLEVITGAAYDKELQGFVNTVFNFINIFFTAFAIVALFVSIFVIANSFSILVAQRSRENAMLRALGASRSQILGSTFLESFVVGLIASVVGVLAGLLVALGIKFLLQKTGVSGLPSSGLVLKPRTIIVGIAVGTIVTVLASILPAIRASRVKPLAALRDVAIDRAATSKVRLGFGLAFVTLSGALLALGLSGKGGSGALRVGIAAALALFAVTFLGPLLAKPIASALGRSWFGGIVMGFGGLVVLGSVALVVKSISDANSRLLLSAIFGMVIGVYLFLTGKSAFSTSGHIARENAIRNPSRTASTALALTIGTALVSAILVLSTSLKDTFKGTLEKAVRADFVIADADQFGFGPEVAAAVASIPGVVASSSKLDTQVRFGFPARTRTLSAVDPAQFEQVANLGDVEGSFSVLNEIDTIAVDKKAAKDNGYKLGDVIPPLFANGSSGKLKVVALYDNASGLGNSYYVTSTKTMAKYDPAARSNFIYVKSDGKNAKAFRKAADEALASFPAAELQSKKEFADAQIGQFNQFLALINALLMLAIIIAILGIANTLRMSIFERTREIGLLRTVGMSRRQVKDAIRWEAIVVATLGAVIGIVIGTGFGSALVHVLGKDDFVKLSVPVQFLIPLALLASIVGLYAARKPAKDAAKLNILRAIATE